MAVIGDLAAFIARRGDRSAEVVWDAALAMLVRTVDEARETPRARWRYWPPSELRRLRRGVAEALELARLAVALQQEENERGRELDEELAARAAEEGRKRRRAQTLPAERARLAAQAERRRVREVSASDVREL